jgi:uncharacterized membrane protein
VSNKQPHGQLEDRHSVDSIKYTTEKQKHYNNSHRVNLGNSSVEIIIIIIIIIIIMLLLLLLLLLRVFLPYMTKRSTRAIGTRKITLKRVRQF